MAIKKQSPTEKVKITFSEASDNLSLHRMINLLKTKFQNLLSEHDIKEVNDNNWITTQTKILSIASFS